MLFNSFGFLGFFFEFVPIYYLTAHRYRWLLLIAVSLSLVCTMVVLPALLVLRYRGNSRTNPPRSS